MKHAFKTESKKVTAYCLGAHSSAEEALLREGAIRLLPDGNYELFSLEATGGKGEIAHPGDYFKVVVADGKSYPYPNSREFFLVNHRALGGDEYEQTAHPLAIWRAGDPVGEEIRFLLERGRLTLRPEDPQHYFNAFLWGSQLSAAQDATLILYSVDRDARGAITDISFGFISAEEFSRTYRLCPPENS